MWFWRCTMLENNTCHNGYEMDGHEMGMEMEMEIEGEWVRTSEQWWSCEKFHRLVFSGVCLML